MLGRAILSSIIVSQSVSATMARPRPPPVRVTLAGETEVNSLFQPRDPEVVPAGFKRTCDEMGWDPEQMWDQLSERSIGRNGRCWWESDNESYIYFNKGDGQWWIDGPSGAGLYVLKDSSGSHVPPAKGWIALSGVRAPVPEVLVVEEKGTDEQHARDL